MSEYKRICHCCGKEIGQEDYVCIEKTWGYFSNHKDGQKHKICLCEPCYDAWTKKFKYAPEIEEIKEFL